MCDLMHMELMMSGVYVRVGVAIFVGIVCDQLENVQNPPEDVLGPLAICGNHRYMLDMDNI